MKELERFLHDEGRKEKRERALGRDIDDVQHGQDEVQEKKLQEVLGDAKYKVLLGKVMGRLYPNEVDDLFQRMALQKATLDDLKKINTARYELEQGVIKADELRAGLDENDIEHLAERNGDIDSLAGLLKDPQRFTEVVRDHFYDMGAEGRFEEMQKIADSQKALKEIRASKEFATADREARALVAQYGFNYKDYSQLEEGSFTKDERIEEEEKVRLHRGTAWKAVDWAMYGGILRSPSQWGASKEIRREEKKTREYVKTHLRERMNPVMRLLDRAIPGSISAREIDDVMRRVAKIESLGKIKDQYKIMGTILAESISKDAYMLNSLLKESEGGARASAIETSPFNSIVDVESAYKQSLNITSYKNGFKAAVQEHTRQRRLTDPNFDPTTIQNTSEGDALIDSYQKGLTGEKGPGFFERLLGALRQVFSTQNRSQLKQDTSLWQAA